MVADHIIPVHVRPDLLLNLGNTECRCVSHNRLKAERDNERFGGPNLTAADLTDRQRLERQKVNP